VCEGARAREARHAAGHAPLAHTPTPARANHTTTITKTTQSEFAAAVEQGFQATPTWHQGGIVAAEAGAAGLPMSTGACGRCVCVCGGGGGGGGGGVFTCVEFCCAHRDALHIAAMVVAMAQHPRTTHTHTNTRTHARAHARTHACTHAHTHTHLALRPVRAPTRTSAARAAVHSCSWALSMSPKVGWGDSPTAAARPQGGTAQRATAGWLSMLAVFEPHWQVRCACACVCDSCSRVRVRVCCQKLCTQCVESHAPQS
jgi:hypothetical protein